MHSSAVAELMAARRYTTNVLLQLDVSAKDMTLGRFLELLDYFAKHPTEYLELCQEQ